METSFGYISDKAYFSSDEKKWINKIRKLKEQFPDYIEILKEPETNDGCIYCTVPAGWMKLVPPRSLTMTDEERAAIAERLNAARGHIHQNA